MSLQNSGQLEVRVLKILMCRWSGPAFFSIGYVCIVWAMVITEKSKVMSSSLGLRGDCTNSSSLLNLSRASLSSLWLAACRGPD